MKILKKDILNFLKECLIYSWANPNVDKKILGDNIFALNYENNKFSYEDIYTMVKKESFYGKEVVVDKKSNKIVFERSYSGGMVLENKRYKKEFIKSTFAFLQTALNKCKFDGPERGPETYKNGKWLYVHNKYKNNKASEMIYYNNELVHIVNFIVKF